MWLKKTRALFIQDAVKCGITRSNAISCWHELYSDAISDGAKCSAGSTSGEQDSDVLWIFHTVSTESATSDRMWWKKTRALLIQEAMNCGLTRTKAISCWHGLYSDAISDGNGCRLGSYSGERDDDVLWILHTVNADIHTSKMEGSSDANAGLSCAEENARLNSVNKLLTYLCRHGALEEGYVMDEVGGILVKEMLQYHNTLRQWHITEHQMRRAVAEDHMLASERKHRLKLYEDKDGLQRVKACYGHDMHVGAGITDQLAFTQVWHWRNIVCCHVTYRWRWRKIQKEGLNQMNRKHIHFVDHIPSPSECNKDILIILNVRKWLTDGGLLFKTEGHVLLTPGFNGTVPRAYFQDIREIEPILEGVSGRGVKRHRRC